MSFILGNKVEVLGSFGLIDGFCGCNEADSTKAGCSNEKTIWSNESSPA